MPSRRGFIAGVALTGAMAALPDRARGAAASPSPSPAPTPTPPPSDAALATARGMRAYDASLSDAEVTTIAQQIDDNLKSESKLNPAGRRLKNSDEPSTVFRVQF